MSDIHITREILRAVTKGELPPRVLTQIGWEHLMKLCPDCRQEYTAWQREETQPANYDSAFRVIPLLLEKQNQDMQEKQKSAEKDFKEILKLTQKDRLTRIRRASTRFRGLTLAHMLLERAKQHMPAEPQEVYDLAEAANAVLLRSPEIPGINDLLARAIAFMGNSLRAKGNLQEAEERLAGARSIIRQRGVTELLVYAEVDWFEGILRKDQRRFREAESLLTRSAALYNLAGEGVDAARSLISLGLMYYDQRELPKASEVTQAALQNITPQTELRLYLCARYNLALFLCEAGNYREAAEALLGDDELYEQFSDLWTQLRWIWLKGKIAAGFSRMEEAEEAFVRVRDGFMAQGIGYDAAMVSLDLSLIYLRQRRTPELKKLAEEVHLTFAAGDIHREAIAALLLFEDAVRQENLTAGFVQDLTTYLEKARSNPSLRFRR